MLFEIILRQRISKLCEKGISDKNDAFALLDRLHKSYGLIEPLVKVSDMKAIDGYQLCDQPMKTYTDLAGHVTFIREDAARDLNTAGIKRDLEQLVMRVDFRGLVRNIFHDQPIGRLILPSVEFEVFQGHKSYELQKVSWNITNVEIDI